MEKTNKWDDATYRSWLEKVKQDGRVLKDVPEELKDEDLCLEAVEMNASAVYYLPENLRNTIFYEKAVKLNYLVPHFWKLNQWTEKKTVSMPKDEHIDEEVNPQPKTSKEPARSHDPKSRWSTWSSYNNSDDLPYGLLDT